MKSRQKPSVKRGPRVTFTLSQELRQRIINLAKRDERKEGEYIRRVLTDHANNKK